YGDLKVSGTIYGWNVPSEIIFTSVHSGGNFGKWKGMHDWIQGNGCSGYHVCNEFEVLAFIETGKTINWGSVSDTQLGAIYTLQENCDQWTTNAGIGWRGTVWTINNQFDGSVNCAQNFRVLCCK
ncbi:MAG: hypothetical protein NTW30_01280, partial [Candidatus Aenigmarchaeota archaeon]|nr:hypothetical protein [Candidatus Aenigmarchaeota archaeon]